MTITLQNISKRFNYDWIFRNINGEFEAGKKYAVTGANGSGKSTLLKIFSGSLTPSEGKIIFSHNGKNISADEVYKYVSYSAPYIELIEEFTLQEILQFHFRFKEYMPGMHLQNVFELLELPKQKHKLLRDFSSGMKQRVKLVLAILSNAPVVLLDEPTTNLDATSVDWYHSLIQKYTQNKLLLIASNMQREYAFCDEVLDIIQFKPA